MDTADSRLGRGRNLPTRLRCCAAGDGRMVAASALRAHCPPSTAPIRTSALPIRLEPSRLPQLPGPEAGGEDGLGPWPWMPRFCSLWRLHRNEPGWFVGEHMQERRLAGEDDDETLTDGPGERAPPPPPPSLTRVGDAER
ncbi:hypothetical protein GUJ93_ZPchr0006g42006 [Zizania palustris]|uniref:Uncharacterized protein n=1 Tax=Zizania palustris TaxID=103762 RepID=A0A8J5SD99_ZIZPA|nr:hypothetical protein GUJ93_ZPchr0006g42006 [Zizania palustris]